MDKEKRLPLGSISIKNIPQKISFVVYEHSWTKKIIRGHKEYRFSHIEEGNAVYVTH